MHKNNQTFINEDKERLEIMAIQLEDAVYEREKLKLMFQEQLDANIDLRDKLANQLPAEQKENIKLQTLLDDMNGIVGKEIEKYTENALLDTGALLLQKVEKIKTKLKTKYADLNTLKAQLIALSKGFKEKDADLLQQSTLIADLEKSKSSLQQEILSMEDSNHEKGKVLESELLKLKSEIVEVKKLESSTKQEVTNLKSAFEAKTKNLSEELLFERKKSEQIKVESEQAVKVANEESKSQLKQLEIKIIELQREFELETATLKANEQKFGKEIQILKDQLSAKDLEISGLKLQLDSENVSFETRCIDLKAKEMELQQLLEKKGTSFESQKESLMLKIKELEATIKQCEYEKQVVEANLVKSVSDYQTLKHELDSIQLESATKANKSKDELFEANRKFNSLNRKFKDSQNDAELYKNQCDILEAEVMISKREVTIINKMKVASDTPALDKLIAEKDAKIQDSNAKIESLLEELDSKDQELDDLAHDGDETLEELERLQNMLFDIKSSRADLMERLDDSQLEIDELKRELAALRS